MAKFNSGDVAAKAKDREVKVAELREHPKATTNEEGGLAFEMGPKMELYTRVATCLVGEPKFYDASGKETLEAIRALIEKVAKKDPEFVLKLAAHARNELYLRTVSVMLLVEATNHEGCRPFVRGYTPAILKRADEPAEAIAAWIATNGHIGDKAKHGMLPHSLRKGIADALRNYNEYNLAKYDREGPVWLRDVFRIVHPKPKGKEQKALWKRVIERKLKTPETWETLISGKGSTKENWTKALETMGIFAAVRNLRNLLEKDVDMKPAIEMLTDEKVIRKSMLMPFRFYSAHRELEQSMSSKAGKVLDALDHAIDLSVQNVPELEGRTLVAVDLSGSMTQTTISAKSSMTPRAIACVLASVVHKLCKDVTVIAFTDKIQLVHLKQSNGTLTNAKAIDTCGLDGGTSAYLVGKWMLDEKERFDRVVLLSDMQCYNNHPDGYYDHIDPAGRSLVEYVHQYRQKVNKDLKMFSVDLVGHGTSQFPQDDPLTVMLAGWSDRVIGFMANFEKRTEMLKHVQSIGPKTFLKTADEDA